ncbi:MAG: hypothetical protein E7586_00890 [Ruminococcaceae bacterium]|nr:hypothetical protein [Oscillospiraceae bacterium]
MKPWIIYFLCVTIMVTGVSFGMDKLVEQPDLPTISVSVKGEITQMTAEEFTLRVLLAEGTELRHKESKKALAVAARSCGTYLSLFGCKHDDFDVCDNGDCCFNLGDPTLAERDYLEKCLIATQETLGLCLTFENLPAMALFSLCNGSGSIDCPEFSYITAVKEEETCQLHTKESVLDFAVLQEIAGCERDELTQNSVLVYKDNNKCDFAILGGKYIKAEELSKALSTDSGEFALEFTDDGIHTLVYGVGKGFGLSICGSEKKAESGWDFKEIIENYYPGLTLNKIYAN